MRTLLPLALLLAGCATAPEAGLPVAQGAASSTLTLTVTDPVYSGGLFDVLVTGASPGDAVQVVVGLGGGGSGPCPSFLGGNCLDILPPYRLPAALTGTADASGEVMLAFAAFPTNIPAGEYWLQALVADGADSNESPAVSHEVRLPCINDAYEPNDTQAEATLDPPTPFSAVACDGSDSDWFAFTVPDQTELTFVLTHDSTNDGDLDIQLHDASGTQIDASAGVDDTETLVGENTSGAPTTFAVEVDTYEDFDGDGTDYTGERSFAPLPPPAP